MAQKAREFDVQERKLLKEIAVLREKINQQEVIQNTLAQDNQEAKATISELKATVSSLEQILCVKEDINKQLDTTAFKLASTLRERENLASQVQTLLQGQNIANNKILELEKELTGTKTALVDRDEYVANLKRLIIEMKEKQPLYIPQRVIL